MGKNKEELKRKIGILEYVAQGGSKGIKFVGDDQWYNPRDEEARACVQSDLKGKQIEMTFDPKDDKKFISVVWLDVKNPEFIKPSAESEVNKQVAKEKKATPINSKEDVKKNKEADSKNYFSGLNGIKCNVTKKNSLNYISWSDAWAELKKVYPGSEYKVYENNEGMPYFHNECGALVKVGVKINKKVSDGIFAYLEHIVWLPVMDYNNNAMKKESQDITKFDKKIHIDAYTMFDINKALQRALTKAIAMHGLGLYVYQGEDVPRG